MAPSLTLYVTADGALTVLASCQVGETHDGVFHAASDDHYWRAKLEHWLRRLTAEVLAAQDPPQTVHRMLPDLSIACPIGYAALCSSVITEVTCDACLATAVDPGLCNLPTPDGPCQEPAGHRHLTVVTS